MKPLRFNPERDLEILDWVYHCRFLTTDQLLDLFPPLREPRDGEQPAGQGLRHRLPRLAEHNYLTRRRIPAQGTFGWQYVYGLGNKGADELTLHKGYDRKLIDYTQRMREHSAGHIRHSLMISGLRYALEFAIRAQPKIRLTFWRFDGSFKDEVTFRDVVRDKDGERATTVTVPIIPDAYFALDDGEALRYFFVEADRSTMTHERFLKKMKGYYHFYTQDKHKAYGMGLFRVLTITISDARRDTLLDVTKAAYTDRRHGAIFCFACQDSYADQPSAVLDSIWLTPQDVTMFEDVFRGKRRSRGEAIAAS